MLLITPTFISQAGLIIGFFGSVLLAFSAKVGVISKNGKSVTVIFNGLDPMISSEINKNRVLESHWRNRVFTPIGWAMLSISFLLQFSAVFITTN